MSSRILQGAAIALCALSLSLVTASAADAPKPNEARGTIKSIDLDAHRLTVASHDGKTTQAYQWNDKTQFTEAGKAVSASTLKNGEHVRLVYAKSGEVPTLQRVSIASSKAAKSHPSHRTSAKSS